MVSGGNPKVTQHIVIDVPLSNLRSLLVQQCQPGVQLQQDGQGH